MSWIKLENHIFDKTEIHEISQSLSIDPDAVVGKCARVWAWFDVNTTNGVTKSVTKSLLDRYCGVTGFCDAMVSCGWMIEINGMIELPNYDRHNSATAKSRALGSKRQNKYRMNASSNASSNVIYNDDTLRKSSYREEKRREDINNSQFEENKKEDVISPLFDEFWKNYPNKKAKPAALRAWKKIKPGEIETLMAGLIQQCKTIFLKDDGKFIPHPATWLNNRRWEDGIQVASVSESWRKIPNHEMTPQQLATINREMQERLGLL